MNAGTLSAPESPGRLPISRRLPQLWQSATRVYKQAGAYPEVSPMTELPPLRQASGGGAAVSSGHDPAFTAAVSHAIAGERLVVVSFRDMLRMCRQHWLSAAAVAIWSICMNQQAYSRQSH